MDYGMHNLSFIFSADNNELTGFIKPSRGIRQGDPLSPYIFIMCMELLANNLIKESLKSNSGIGAKLYPKAIIISLGFYLLMTA